MHAWSVTYAIITPESAEQGVAASSGFIGEKLPFRDAVRAVQETRTSRVSGITAIEASESPFYAPGWITIYNGMEFETGACEERSIHFPPTVTPSSRRRVARLLGCRV